MIIQPEGLAVLTKFSEGGKSELRHIELCGRLCYHSPMSSEDDFDRTKRFVENRIKQGHESILEHLQISVLYHTNIGTARELLRHRFVSPTQDSTRYVNFDKEGFIFMEPHWALKSPEALELFKKSCEFDEEVYKKLLGLGLKPEEARDILPLGLCTQLVASTNVREWRHVIKLRTASDAHPKIRRLMELTKREFQKSLPVLFDDL